METRVLALSSGVKVVCVELPIPQPVVGAMRGESVAFFALPQSVFGHFATLSRISVCDSISLNESISTPVSSSATLLARME
jgi:hypothetical protein